MTDQQRKFCIAYVQSQNAVKAAQEAGYSTSYCKSRSYELLKMQEIVTEVERLENEFYKDAFKQLGPKAIKAIGEIIESGDNPTARLKASELILKQIGFSDHSKVDQELTISLRLPKELDDGR